MNTTKRLIPICDEHVGCPGNNPSMVVPSGGIIQDELPSSVGQ